MKKVIGVIALILLPFSILFFWMTTQSRYWVDWSDGTGSEWVNCWSESTVVVWPWTQKMESWNYVYDQEKQEYISSIPYTVYQPILWNLSTGKFEKSRSWQKTDVNHIGDSYPKVMCHN